MYDKLIKQLRASCESCKLWDGYKCCLKGECSAQKSLQAADAIERLDAIAQTYVETVHEIEDKRKWIPVTERLPDIGEEVLCFCRANICLVLSLDGNLWREGSDHYYMSGFVSHWMPLPQPPESEDE